MQGSASGKRRRINFTVSFVLFLFAYIYCTVVFVSVLPWLEGSVQGVTHTALFTGVTGLALSMYFCCVFTDPGKVPSGWLPDSEGGAFVEVKKKGGEARFCNKCTAHKPPRTHHCRHCDRCILRMDHHCSWVNNCIGHANYKSFFLFLFYVNIALAYGLVLLLARAVSGADAAILARMEALQAARVRAGAALSFLDVSTSSSALQAAAIILTTLLLLSLGVLLGWHVYLISGNKTTVEHHEGVRARRTAQSETFRRGDAHGKHIYNVGLYANVRAVLGAQPLLWLWPGRKAAGLGLSFPTNPAA